MVESIAHPGIAHAVGREALVILAPDALIFQVYTLKDERIWCQDSG